MPQINVDRALQALDGNDELLKDLANIFVEDAPVLLRQLKTALAEGLPLEAKSAVHSLKGLIATFFANDGVEIAQRLEDSAAKTDLSLFFNGDLAQLENCVDSINSEFVALGWMNLR